MLELLLLTTFAYAQAVELDVLLSSAPTPAEPTVPAMPRVEIIHPKEGDKYPYVQRSFVLGNAQPGSTVTLNGLPVDLHPGGGFLAMVPFSTGTFQLELQAQWLGQTASTQRVVEVALPGGYPEAQDEPVAVEPEADLELRVGDIVLVRCKGPSGQKGRFHIGGISGDLPMAENPGFPGLYEGHYEIRPKDRGADLKISCAMKAGKADAPGKLTIADSGVRRVAQTLGRLSVLPGPAGGYTLFFPPGVRLELDGRAGGMHRVSLSDHEGGWIDKDNVALLPEGTPPPRGQVGRSMTVAVGSDSVRVYIDTELQLPFEVRQEVEPLSFELRFFNAYQRFDRIKYAPDDPVVKDIRWRQESSRVVSVAVATRMQWGWGYDAFYDAGGRFVLEIRRPPDLTHSENVLAGRKIILDPGHGPQTGAIGPLGTTERDVNLDLATRLQDMLLAEGADVYLTHTSTEGPSLQSRSFMAWEQRGDLFISIHNNALPVTVDPFEKPRGYMVFYYQPQSQRLAEAFHGQYTARQADLADESMQWGDLYVCRTPQMPAVLPGTAYMMFPEQEAKLRTPEYLDGVARTHVEAIRSFYRAYRSLQLRSEDERKAARR
ncbi:MAG: N-acetylmuramoyl-L-alanine amidase [Elusimicrobiota bacterium]